MTTVILLLGIPAKQALDEWRGQEPTEWFYYAPVFALLGGVFWYQFRQQTQTGAASWRTYELTLDDDRIERRAEGLQPMVLRRSEVQAIVEKKGKGVSVVGSDPRCAIFIPEELSGYEEVSAWLSAIRPFEAPSRHVGPLGVVVALVMLGLWVGTGLVPDIRLAMGLGVALWDLLGVFVYGTLTSPTEDKRSKARSLAPFALVALAPAARLLLHLLGAAGPG